MISQSWICVIIAQLLLCFFTCTRCDEKSTSVSECGNGLPADCYSMLSRGDGFPRLLVSSLYGSAGDLTAAKRTAYNAWRKGKRNPVGSSLIQDRTKKPAGLDKKDFDANSMLQKLKKALTRLRLRNEETSNETRNADSFEEQYRHSPQTLKLFSKRQSKRVGLNYSAWRKSGKKRDPPPPSRGSAIKRYYYQMWRKGT